jgi:2-desacetyl-2-hydroxyethyl bacteriochlorophyllide A dehydrogenase
LSASTEAGWKASKIREKAAFYEGNKTFSVRGGVAVPPGPGEVRLQVAYTGICGTDVHIWHGAMDKRVRIPQVIGHEMSGALAEPLAVACHDVKRGEVRPGELAVVIGGGPIGMFVAMVARQAGARVVISELSPFRLAFARRLGFDAFSPQEVDLPAWVREHSGGSGADIVFEVSGAKAAALGMTELLAIRGRVLLVAIYPQPVELNLFHFFWKELRLIGARVYERDDYEQALQLMAAGALPLAEMITAVQPLDQITAAFQN